MLKEYLGIKKNKQENMLKKFRESKNIKQEPKTQTNKQTTDSYNTPSVNSNMYACLNIQSS